MQLLTQEYEYPSNPSEETPPIAQAVTQILQISSTSSAAASICAKHRPYSIKFLVKRQGVIRVENKTAIK